MMSGLFGACLFMYGMPIRRKGLYGFVIFLIVCMAGVFWLTDGKLEAVEQARKEMMRVISEQKKSLYLKAYVGSVYKDGVWRKMPEGQDPLQWFLTTSRTGNQMLYASAAVEAFRAHGIPARYVEGYYLGASKIQDSKNGEVSITGENAHAWVEVYFDGVGWKAVDVTPGYYYNVATLQKMVNTPEQIKKNAAMILLGAVTVLVIAGFILFVILEIRLWLLEQTLKKQYEQADMD